MPSPVDSNGELHLWNNIFIELEVMRRIPLFYPHILSYPIREATRHVRVRESCRVYFFWNIPVLLRVHTETAPWQCHPSSRDHFHLGADGYAGSCLYLIKVNYNNYIVACALQVEMLCAFNYLSPGSIPTLWELINRCCLSVFDWS